MDRIISVIIFVFMLVFTVSAQAKNKNTKQAKKKPQASRCVASAGKSTKGNRCISSVNPDQEMEKKLRSLPKVEIESAERSVLLRLHSKNKVDIERVSTREKLETGTWKVKKGFLLINYGSGKEKERIRYHVQIKKGQLLINQRKGEAGYWKVDSQPQAVEDNKIIKDVKATAAPIKSVKEANDNQSPVDPDINAVESDPDLEN